MFINLHPLILASGSPRRKQYLNDAGLQFTVVFKEIDERHQPGEKVEDYVLRMAKEKALAVSALSGSNWVVSADTTVTMQGQILGKPGDEEQAVSQLMFLAGQEHQVMTAFSVANFATSVMESAVIITQVRFWNFSEELARAYVYSGESFDKAGGYGIQGRGSLLVEKVTGSYSNIVGLPMAELLQVLLFHGVIAPKVKKD